MLKELNPWNCRMFAKKKTTNLDLNPSSFTSTLCCSCWRLFGRIDLISSQIFAGVCIFVLDRTRLATWAMGIAVEALHPFRMNYPISLSFHVCFMSLFLAGCSFKVFAKHHKWCQTSLWSCSTEVTILSSSSKLNSSAGKKVGNFPKNSHSDHDVLMHVVHDFVGSSFQASGAARFTSK